MNKILPLLKIIILFGIFLNTGLNCVFSQNAQSPDPDLSSFEKELFHQYESMLCSLWNNKRREFSKSEVEAINSNDNKKFMHMYPSLENSNYNFTLLSIKGSIIGYTGMSFATGQSKETKKYYVCKDHHNFFSLGEEMESTCQGGSPIDNLNRQMMKSGKENGAETYRNFSICDSHHIEENGKCVNPCKDDKENPLPNVFWTGDVGNKKQKFECSPCPPPTKFNEDKMSCLNEDGCKIGFQASTTTNGENKCCPYGWISSHHNKCKPDPEVFCKSCEDSIEKFSKWSIEYDNTENSSPTNNITTTDKACIDLAKSNFAQYRLSDLQQLRNNLLICERELDQSPERTFDEYFEWRDVYSYCGRQAHIRYGLFEAYHNQFSKSFPNCQNERIKHFITFDSYNPNSNLNETEL